MAPGYSSGMERSNKHGPRVDDAMSTETEALQRGAPVEPRVEESREKEPFDAAPTDDVELRSELAKRLRPSVFPADRTALEQVATDEQAPGYILGLLRRLPDETTYGNTQEVWTALGR